MMRKLPALLSLLLLCTGSIWAQPAPRRLPAKRTTASFKIDGSLDEAAWKEAEPARDFVEWRPTFGAAEDPACKTEIYILYDNTSIYVGGYCHEKSVDSVSRELVGRDQVGVNDYVGIVFDTYLDKINALGFYVTPLGEQFDARYSNGEQMEDASWNAVWDSEAKLVADGWTFEMRIPYSALRFVSKDNQTWGLNITRNRKKIGRQYMWNPVDPKVNGFINQEGEWTGIEKIKAPVRLSFSPYFSTYLNHYPYNTNGVKNWTSSVNGGVDVKYGLTDAFTLDMTLIPDFGQVQSDNKVLNLTPFEVKYAENRPFFIEGTDLFSKGNLFYSRRIGSQPVHYYDVQDSTSSLPGHIRPGEEIVKNPVESKMINGTKITGRTKHGLGVGFFNAMTRSMYATLEDVNSKTTRKVETNPFTNYNIIVLDQTLRNNSAVTFINTNVTRSGKDYDANVSAGLFNLNNKKNTYNVSGKLAVSQLMYPGKNIVGYSHNFGLAKTGKWSFQVFQELTNDKYDINDMGLLFNNNYLDHTLWTSYRWLKPRSWYNRIQVNYNAYYSMLYKDMPGKNINSRFQTFNTNVNANIQLKNLWWAGMFMGYVSKGNDFYEPRQTGWSFRGPQRIQFNPWFETNATRKYYVNINYFVGLRKFALFNSPNHEIDLMHRYRFNDRFSISHSLVYNPTRNDAGFYTQYYEKLPDGSQQFKDIIFSRRDRKTVENILSFKYSFNNKSGLTVRVRHYWSKVQIRELYDLQSDGSLKPSTHSGQVDITHQNVNIFNVDAVYTLQFAPGSFINIVWKDQSVTSDEAVQYRYFRNLDRTIVAPQNNNLSLKVIYYLDYLDFRKWKKKKDL
jgi:hypothetical protein